MAASCYAGLVGSRRVAVVRGRAATQGFQTARLFERSVVHFYYGGQRRSGDSGGEGRLSMYTFIVSMFDCCGVTLSYCMCLGTLCLCLLSARLRACACGLFSVSLPRLCPCPRVRLFVYCCANTHACACARSDAAQREGAMRLRASWRERK